MNSGFGILKWRLSGLGFRLREGSGFGGLLPVGEGTAWLIARAVLSHVTLQTLHIKSPVALGDRRLTRPEVFCLFLFLGHTCRHSGLVVVACSVCLEVDSSPAPSPWVGLDGSLAYTCFSDDDGGVTLPSRAAFAVGRSRPLQQTLGLGTCSFKVIWGLV